MIRSTPGTQTGEKSLTGMQQQTPQYDVAEIMGGLYGPGFIGLKNAFSKEWVQQLHEDVLRLYDEALNRPGGAVGRGPKRHYVEIHPEDITMPKMGDISARSALTIHRGTANHSNSSRPALVLGVDAPGGINAERHDLQFTRSFFETLSEGLRNHLTCRVVDKLEAIHQAHTIERLMMGEA